MGGLIFFIIAAVAATSVPQVQVSTIDGGIAKGELQQLNSEQITLKASDGDKVLPLDQVLSVVQQTRVTPVEKPIGLVELLDGSKLPVWVFTVENGRASFGWDWSTRISTESIHSVHFSPPEDSTSAAWPANVGADATSDLLAVRKKDHIDFMEGRIGNVGENQVILKVDNESYPINRSKVDGWIYYHKTSDKFPEPLCIVVNWAGCRFNVRELAFEDYPSNSLLITTLCGEKFTLSWDTITKLDFSAGKIAYLSDLEPAATQWTPYLDFGNAAPAMAEYYAPRRDEGREHQPLRLGGKTYNKGLSLYSRTAIDYRIPAGMKKFKATAGIDDSVREVGNVRLSISADGKKLFDQAVTGKDAPVELDLNVAGTKRLSILVDYGNQFDAGDYLDLADARMLK